ncbi:sugar phosphate isomerase/epimerase family protein [Pedobacter sp. UBA5917]|uniref:sugar phosphate isomerase/epimerase family protein n=1 Tax=Pedobacter sp. UBA5917 TaxID=1947061 RepID=UPI0025F85372|nr:sugar phosphate isomerase/epimerase [Pedobacter sp. UBA5917]
MRKIKQTICTLLITAAVCAGNFQQSYAQSRGGIGLQLFSLRSLLPKDVAGNIEKVAKAGYNQVELYGFTIKDQFWGLTPLQLKALLDQNKLEAISGHFNVSPYLASGDETELRAAIEAAKVLKLKYVTIPWLAPEFRKSAADYKTLAKRLNRAGQLCQNSGLSLAYHNHDFEFEKYEGQTGMDILLKNTDKKLVSFEMDIYWTIRSGIDPVKLFKANPGRFALWHVKDMDKDDPKLNAEVGSGSIDYVSLFKQAKRSGMKYFFVEHETNYKPNIIGSITNSNKYIRKNIMR